MHQGRRLLTGVAVACSFALFGPATALADGSGCSAGDNQYVDPLGGNCNNTPGHHHHSGGGGSNPSGSTTSGSTSGTSSTTTTVSTTTSTTSHTASDPKGKTLPFTGLDVWPCVALGVCLIGSGAVLRRTVRLPRA